VKPAVEGEAGVGEEVHALREHLHAGEALHGVVRDEREGVRVLVADAPPRVRHHPGLVLPGGARVDDVVAQHVLVQELTDGAQQVVLVAHVVVERHRLDAEIGTELAHAQRVEAFGVDAGERGLGDSSATQREPGRALVVVGVGDGHEDKLTRSVR
jgi:hypothetical protein